MLFPTDRRIGGMGWLLATVLFGIGALLPAGGILADDAEPEGTGAQAAAGTLTLSVDPSLARSQQARPVPEEWRNTTVQAWLPGPDGFTRTFLALLEGDNGESRIEPPERGWPEEARPTVLAAPTACQFPDGTIVLPSVGAASESAGGRIGARWDFEFTRWGRYDVEVTCSQATDSPAVVEFVIGGDAVRSRQVTPTGGPARFVTVPFGRIHVPESGRKEIAVRLAEDSVVASSTALRIRSVVLRPAPEGGEIAQAEDGGPIVLHARDAIVHGVMLRYEPAEKKNCLGFWTNPRDYAEWRFDVRRPGTYSVEVHQGCGAGQGGSTAEIVFGATRLGFTVEDTGHFQNFVPRTVGRIRIAEAGRHALTISALDRRRAAVMDVREIRLLPVDSDGDGGDAR